MRSSRFPYVALLSVAIALAPALADAQEAQTEQQPSHGDETKREGQAGRVLRFLAGGATGLVVHEAGHVGAGLLLGANPGFKRLDYGFIPFFAVTHDQVSRRHEYLISSAGFLTQHVANEWLLAGDPMGESLRDSSSAFRKGWVTFNLATSAVYSAAAFVRAGPPERDTRGMAVSAGVPEPVIGILILTPALLDGVRYLADDPAWARWSSRAVKAGLLLLAIR